MTEYRLSLFNRDWENAGLLDPNEFADYAEFVNQEEGYLDCYEGEWFYPHDESLTIYCGTFGNYNSPFCSEHTFARVYDTKEEYQKAVRKWESYPEYLPQRDEEESEDAIE